MDSADAVDKALTLLLSEEELRLGEDLLKKGPGAYENAAAFARLCNGPNNVEQIDIDPFTYDLGRSIATKPFQSYEAWERLGAGVGKLKGIRTVSIRGEPMMHPNSDDPDDDEAFDYISPDWEAVGLILRCIPGPFCLDLSWLEACDNVDIDSLAAVLRRDNSRIREFMTPYTFNWSSFAPIFWVLPALEAIALVQKQGDDEGEDEEATAEDVAEMHAQHAEILGRLLQLSTLRSVEFTLFEFTEQCCGTFANALRNGSPITRLGMELCHFPHGGSNRILHALQENKTVHTFEFDSGRNVDASFGDAMIRLLLVNTTLTHVKWDVTRVSLDEILNPVHHAWLAPLFQVLAYANRTLKSLEVCDVSLTDERTCAALYRMIEKNPVLENLVLKSPAAPEPAELDPWRKVLRSLQTNTTLRSLAIKFPYLFQNPRGDRQAFCTHTIASFGANTTLESLDISGGLDLCISHYLHILDSLKPSPTLRKLELGCGVFIWATREEKMQLASIVKKNCWVEHLDYVVEKVPAVANLLRLNRAGRRYLVDGDAPSLSKGVAVLSAVADSLDCVFTHLLENPMLCDIEKDDGDGDKGDLLRQSKRPRVSEAPTSS